MTRYDASFNRRLSKLQDMFDALQREVDNFLEDQDSELYDLREKVSDLEEERNTMAYEIAQLHGERHELIEKITALGASMSDSEDHSSEE